ncbi:DUF1318 domain-containing protein [bacterium]|nr:DUF1318 domain-containing protein [bacterium]
MKRQLRALLPGTGLLLLLACSVQAPEVRVTGEKTALEREVLGTYERLEEDTWMVASSRAARKEDAGEISEDKSNVLEAIRRQKFNKDDIDEFKRREFAGEAISGLLEIRETALPADDSLQVQLVRDIVAEENTDRTVIMNRVIELKTSLQEASREEVTNIFARMYQGNAEKGVWIQAADGSWSRKK